jgi:hypothetical protein
MLFTTPMLHDAMLVDLATSSSRIGAPAGSLLLPR